MVDNRKTITSLGSRWFENEIHGKATMDEHVVDRTIHFQRDLFIEKVKASIDPNPNEGFVIGLKRRRDFASQVSLDYKNLTPIQKEAMLLALAEDLGSHDRSHMMQLLPPVERIRLILNVLLTCCGLSGTQNPTLLKNLKNSLSHVNEKFFRLVASVPQGASFLVDLRGDLVKLLKKSKKLMLNQERLHSLEYLNDIMRDLFSTQQGVQLKRITLENEKILSVLIKKEAVQKIGSWEDLQRRVNGDFRLCYGLFHANIPDRPLVFVEIAMQTQLAQSIQPILDGKNLPQKAPTHAIFYSVNNTTLGLQGLNLASHLLFLSIAKIKQQYPSCTTFATLSPVPGFSQWFESKLQQGDPTILNEELFLAMKTFCHFEDQQRLPQYLQEKLSNANWLQDQQFCSAMEVILVKLCMRYILFERKGMKILDSVANFHIQNGAHVERINFLADTSPKGLQQSYGIMVNYKYHLDIVDVASVSYKRFSTAAATNLAVHMIYPTDSPIFKALERSQRDSLDIPIFARVFPAKSKILDRGMPVNALYFISLGSVKVCCWSPYFLNAGDAFGEEVLNHEPCRFTIQATTTCHLFMLLKEDLEKLIDLYPDLGKMIKTFMYKKSGYQSKM